jgi:hypothetical protein
MLSTVVLAQEPQHNVVYERHGTMAGEVGMSGFQVVTSESFSFDGAVVKNAPYSAEAVTETTQSLADGNRISRKTKSALYRDSEGRTRREDTLGAIGPWASGDQPAQMISINDPVSKTNMVLDARSKTARKMPSPKIAAEGMALQKLSEMKQVYTVNHPDVKKAEAELRAQSANAGDPAAAETKMHAEMMMTMHTPGMAFTSVSDKNAQKESLGTQMIEGVQAEGMRTTITIPAGAMGNELPINIVSERWYSPDLQTVVMSKHSDPRMGETVYRLTSINRSEPAPSLFQAPADYTISDSPQRMVIKSND